VAIDADGNVYVADTGNDRIQKFSSDGTFIAAWGSSGTGPGQFLAPWDVATSPGGSVYVVDLNARRVQRFDPSGTPLGEWGTMGFDDGQFLQPFGIATDADGAVYVTDFSTDFRNKKVQKFSPTGVFLTKWGSLGSGNGNFEMAAAITVDPDGFIYVTDMGWDRVQKFGPPPTPAAGSSWGRVKGLYH
jgi:DNA-binding beta-propeller fold protein YncE